MDKSVRQTRTRHLREVELLIWLLIILALFAIGFYLYSAKQKTYELHNIFMSDVDGLIVGSPVNFMGVPIGYVNKLKIVNDDEVFVRFIVKDKSILNFQDLAGLNLLNFILRFLILFNVTALMRMIILLL